MGTHNPDGGYSATVSAYLTIDGTRYIVAKTGFDRIVLADAIGRSLGLGQVCDLTINVDDTSHTKSIYTTKAVPPGAVCIEYQPCA